MPRNIPLFTFNRCTSVEVVGDNELRSVCRLRDSVTDAEIAVNVRLPDLEIIGISGYFHHDRLQPPADLDAHLRRVVGVRVGSGMLKIIAGLLGEDENCRQLVYMVEECCHGVILNLTRKVLLQAPDDEAGSFAFFSGLVKKSTRLYDRCAAYAAGSPLVREFEAEKQERESSS
ncbi:MAG: hypothetical protein GXO34_01820 [Deltaproteobacteria bacterium]|nr:hypothetical protein [Deltaproteobacteria bacterium]